MVIKKKKKFEIRVFEMCRLIIKYIFIYEHVIDYNQILWKIKKHVLGVAITILFLIHYRFR